MMISSRFAAAVAIGVSLLSAAPGSARSSRPPKLAVIIVVDQMPADALKRSEAFFGEKGFRRLRDQGRTFSGARYAHAANLTGPGHSVIGTGTYANVSGIVGNHWIDLKANKEVNSAVGPWKAGEKGRCTVASWADIPEGSPRVPNPCNQIGSSLAQRVKERYPGARVVGLALKDRSAILSTGKGADAAYWLDSREDDSAAFVCSAFYPGCSQAVLDYSQEQGLTEKPGDPSVMAMFRLHPEWRRWECSLSSPCEQHCPEDVVAAHQEDYGLGRGFPHPVANATALLYTPYGNDLVEGMAERVVLAHSLGKNPKGQPDVLVVGFSSTDYFGHFYGPDSCEAADGMKHLDATLARFLDFLTTRLGSENLFVIVTADHGVTPIPRVSLQRGVPAGRVDMSDRGKVVKKKIGDLPPLRQRMEFELGRRLGIKLDASTPLTEALIRGYREPGLFLNANRIGAQALPLARTFLSDYLMRVEGVQEVYSSEALSRGEGPQSARLSFYPNRTGDLLIFLAPDWIEWDEDAGTSHGQPHDADARVPLLVWGAGVEPGEDSSQVDMARVAATLSAALGLDSRGMAAPAPLPLRGPSASK